MKRTVLLTLVAAAAMLGIHAAPAQAQATRTWVSGVGDDANPCSRTAPCKTWAGAISKTAAGGEIDCLDPGGYGAVTITKSLTIYCEGAVGGVLVSGQTGFIVNVGPTDVVTLRGMDIHAGSAGGNGVVFVGSGVLHIQDTSIRSFRAGGGNGIRFAPNGNAELYVSDTTITDNGFGTTGTGIHIQAVSGNAKVVLNRLQVENNVAGIKAEGGGGNVAMTVTNTVSAGNAYAGISAIAQAGGGSVRMFVDHSTSVNNSDNGIRAVGANASIYLSETNVTGNNTGLGTESGGQIFSFGNNRIEANGVDGPLPTAASHK